MNHYSNMKFKLTIIYDIDSDNCCNLKIDDGLDINTNTKKFINEIKNINNKRIDFISSHKLNKDIITDYEVKKQFI